MTKKLELQLTNDYIFKRLFSKKGNEDILKDLLEGILEIPIKEVEVMQEVELERVDILSLIHISGLDADTEYEIIGKYIYKNEEGKKIENMDLEITEKRNKNGITYIAVSYTHLNEDMK